MTANRWSSNAPSTMISRHTNRTLTPARWNFEVFAVAVISFLFVKLGLVRGKVATEAVLFATIV